MVLALFLLLFFAADCVMLGVCVARVHSLAREVDTLKLVVQTLGNVQVDMAGGEDA